jgi:hypothetical protein
VSEPLGSDTGEILDALEGTPESGQPFETTDAETSGRDASDTGRDRPPLREDIRDEGGLGFFVRGGDPPEGRTIPFEETRENFGDLLDDERAQLGAGRQRPRQDPDRPTEFTEFDAEAERRQTLAQRRDVASDIDRRRAAREPAPGARQRTERAQRPFTETASEPGRAPVRVQPGLLEPSGPGGAVDLGVEFGERLATRPGQRLGIDSRARPAVDTDTRVDLGIRAALETGTDIRSDLRADALTESESGFETELETETETESELERELETEQFFERERETEIELETETESESELEGFGRSEDDDEVAGFGGGLADETFGSGIQSADEILGDR